MFRLRKYSVSILNRKWESIKSVVKVRYIPRYGEILYIDDIYYRVINVVHSIESNKQGIFIIVEKLDTKPEEILN